MSELSYGTEARTKIVNGANKVADAVKVTLGAKGRNVIIANAPGMPPLITKDGVTVSRSVKQLSDPYEDIGCQLIKEAADKTMKNAGDGTTTATVLAQAMIKCGIQKLDEGHSPMDLKKGMELAVKEVVASLTSQCKQIKGDAALIKGVSALAANNDEELGILISNLMIEIGENGYVTLVESPGAETTAHVVKGMKFDRGYINAEFCTNPSKTAVEFKNPYVLICDRKISLLKDAQPILERVVKTGRPLLIIAEDVDGEAMATMISTRIKQNYPFAAVRAPIGGMDTLTDIATICDTEVISESRAQKLENVDLSQLGRAEYISIDKYTATIIGGAGKKEDIDARIEQIRENIASSANVHEQEHLNKRLAKISQGYATIYVGGHTDVETKEKAHRIDDSLRATRAAIEEGVVPGGGIVYIRAVEGLLELEGDNDGENAGIDIIRESLLAPLTQILCNAGVDAKPIFIEVEKKSGDIGYNVKSQAYEPFFASGIVDPIKVSRVALENAASVAAMLLTTECAIIETK